MPEGVKHTRLFQQAIPTIGTLFLLIPQFWLDASFEGCFKEPAIHSDSHIDRRITVLQELLPLDKEEKTKSRFSFLHVILTIKVLLMFTLIGRS